MKRAVKQSGYIGILLILLGTAGMVFLFMKMYFTPSPTTTGELWHPDAPGLAPTTQYDRLRSDIDAANAVSNQLNTKAIETNSVLNGLK
ncbi:MAG: hypothetical protein WAV98_00860 [Minisyncoccia bacterium]